MIKKYTDSKFFKARFIAILTSTTLVLLSCLAALVLTSANTTNRILDTVTQRELSDEHEALIREVAVHVLEAQAARRGFILTREKLFVDALDESARQLHTSLEQLRKVVTTKREPTGALASQLAMVTTLVAEYEAQLRASIALSQNRPDATKDQYVSTLEGDALGRIIQDHLLAMERSIERQSENELNALLSGIHDLEKSQSWLAILSLLILLGVSGWLFHEGRKRFILQVELARMNELLEQKVEERTAAVVAGESRFRRLVELSADAIILCDADALVLYANPAAHQMIRGNRSSALEGRSLKAVFSPDDAQWFTAWLECQRDSPLDHAFRDGHLIHDNGGTIPVRIGVVAYNQPTGARAQLVIQDLSALRDRELVVKEHLRFIDQLVEALPMPLSVRDERGAFLRINRAYELEHGCNRHEIHQKSVFDVLHYPLAQQVAASDRAALDRLRPLVYHLDVDHAGKNVSHFLSQASVIRRSDGSSLGVITVDTDVSEIRKKEEELQNANIELEVLSHRLIASQETERRRIGRDLHDQVGQILTALKMSLEASVKNPEFSSKLALPLDLVEDALKHTRSLTASLHPHMLEDLGLDAAVKWQVEKFGPTNLKETKVNIRIKPARGDPAKELVAYRVIQESLTNVTRHSNAKHMKIDLQTQGGMLHLSVADDGDGFEAGHSRFNLEHPTSLGIASMQERVTEVGGQFTIESAPGMGTTVRVVMRW